MDASTVPRRKGPSRARSPVAVPFRQRRRASTQQEGPRRAQPKASTAGRASLSNAGEQPNTVTIGKRLAQRIRAYVTSGLSDQREVRSNLEWRLSPRVSVEGSYDNVNDISSSSLGNIGADIRWRLEFE